MERAGDELQLGVVWHAPQDGQGVDLIHHRHVTFEIEVRDIDKAMTRIRTKHRCRHIAAQQHCSRDLRANGRLLIQAAQVTALDCLMVFTRANGQRVAGLQGSDTLLNCRQRVCAGGARIGITAAWVDEVFRRPSMGGRCSK